MADEEIKKEEEAVASEEDKDTEAETEVSEADEGDGGRDGSPQGGHPLYRGHHLLIGHSRVDVLLLDWRFSNNHCSTR